MKLDQVEYSAVEQEYDCERSQVVDYESMRPRRWASKSWRLTGCRRLGRPIRRLCQVLCVTIASLVGVVLLTGMAFPSYTILPDHYQQLRQSMIISDQPGRGNPKNEKIFLAASIYDDSGTLASGQWGKSILDLIDLLGEDNVFLSIYENNSGRKGSYALRHFRDRVNCTKSIVYESKIDEDMIPHTMYETGPELKRISYLAEVRNRALEPLSYLNQTYDKVLIVNDVIFDAKDAVNLLFSTNHDQAGKARYRAACAVDFGNPFKFYDTFATRDLEGYSMGVPLYPWFSKEGKAISRKDVQQQKDAVRVKSCWGGMVAFDGQYFQGPDPVKFRYEPEPYWDASECCLVHADILERAQVKDDMNDVGIYMNPYIRVAYDKTTFKLLKVGARFERVFSVIQGVLTTATGMPWYNCRRTERAGDKRYGLEWTEHGLVEAERVAQPGGYCGRYGSRVRRDHKWVKAAMPEGLYD
uniref:ARAD1B17754p n=1 Tax=Blastobotrys adeninivorans TaxID=409370 RepID=A0A060T787_BLAAD